MTRGKLHTNGIFESDAGYYEFVDEHTKTKQKNIYISENGPTSIIFLKLKHFNLYYVTKCYERFEGFTLHNLIRDAFQSNILSGILIDKRIH